MPAVSLVQRIILPLLLLSCGDDTNRCAAAPTLLARSAGIGKLHFDDQHVYFEDDDASGEARIARVSKSGGASSLLYESRSCCGWPFAVEGSRVYYFGGGTTSLLSMPSGGGESTALVMPAPFVFDLRVDASTIYLLERDGTLRAFDKQGGSDRVMAKVGDGPFWLEVDDAGVYWGVGGGPTKTLLTMPKAGGTPSELARVDDLSAVEMDASRVYFTTFDSANVTSTLTSMVKGGNARADVATRSGRARGFTIGHGKAYVAFPDGIFSVPVDGGPWTVVHAATGVREIASDGSSLYWVEGDGKNATLMRACL